MVNIILTVESLNFNIRNTNILNNIDFELHGFQVVTLLGPNGTGKSTLLKSLAAQLYCQQGHILLNDIDAEKCRSLYLTKIGYMPENALIIPELTVMEQLQLMANGKQLQDTHNAIESVIEQCQLKNVLDKRTCQLSLGFTQRLNLAQAIMNKPQLLIMDEPLNGLDPHLIIEFRNIIKQLKKDTLIIMSTHYLAEAQTISDRVLIMQNGQMLDDLNMSQQLEGFDLEKAYMQHTAPQVACT
ncbi:MAG: ABC transporter ATP-binding protein [Alcanivoracaceae bacterium]|nr:ABC transporter ATP-binding protein [Alcanivoracaceae bacterium]